MYAGSEEARRYTLGLLLAGLTPEDVEGHLEGRLVMQAGPSALTDPNNDPVFKEVVPVAQPTHRGPVEILGVTTRVNTSETRTCTTCISRIDVGVRYERVARDKDTIESHHVACFADEFGERRLYGA